MRMQQYMSASRSYQFSLNARIYLVDEVAFEQIPRSAVNSILNQDMYQTSIFKSKLQNPVQVSMGKKGGLPPYLSSHSSQ